MNGAKSMKHLLLFKVINSAEATGIVAVQDVNGRRALKGGY